MLRSSYEIRVLASLGPAALEAFAGLLVDVEPTTTVLSGTFDQAGLQDLLDRVRALGLELVDVELTLAGPPERDGSPRRGRMMNPPGGPARIYAGDVLEAAERVQLQAQ